MLTETRLGDVIAGYGTHVQAVAGDEVVTEHAVAWCGDQYDVSLVGEVEEEGVQKGGEAVGCDDVGRGEGDARVEEVIEKVGCRGG